MPDLAGGDRDGIERTLVGCDAVPLHDLGRANLLAPTSERKGQRLRAADQCHVPPLERERRSPPRIAETSSALLHPQSEPGRRKADVGWLRYLDERVRQHDRLTEL